MKKKIIAMFLVAAMAIGTLVGCGSTDAPANGSATGETAGNEELQVVLSLANSADYYIGTMVGGAVEAAFIEAGVTPQVVDGADDVNNQINQIQNAVTGGADIIYVFPAGDGETYADVLKAAREAGVTVIMSNNYGGEGVADAYVGQDEYQMGVMMAAMVSAWADATYPDAGAGEVGVLALEAAFNQNAIKRCLGMRLVGEKFLRYADPAAIDYVKVDGEPVNYIDENGNEVAVDEPTGGLILDENGYAQLNPYYNEKVKIITYADRNAVGATPVDAQNALETTVAAGENVVAVMSYGDTGAAVEAKMQEMVQDGRIKADISKVAVFCSDLTDVNRELILKSADNSSVMRGVMASGDLIGTICEYAKMAVAGETLPEYMMQPLSYIMVNEDGTDIVSVYYEDLYALPETNLIYTGYTK